MFTDDVAVDDAENKGAFCVAQTLYERLVVSVFVDLVMIKGSITGRDRRIILGAKMDSFSNHMPMYCSAFDFLIIVDLVSDWATIGNVAISVIRH